MLELSGFDLKRARLVPHAVFDSPGDVVGASFLSFAQKQAILRRWEFDVRRMGARPEPLAAVQDAIRTLASERNAPSTEPAPHEEGAAAVFEMPPAEFPLSTR
jgi:hypothetical protein